MTVRSLCEAFATSKMSKENAEYIVNGVRDFKRAKQDEARASGEFISAQVDICTELMAIYMYNNDVNDNYI